MPVKKQKRIFLTESRLGYLLVAPAIILICVIAVSPILQTVRLSFFNMQLQFIDRATFVGLDNYAKLIVDNRFFSALLNTVQFTFFSVFFELIVGMIMALLMNIAFKATGIIRAAVLVPWAIPTSVSALMWSFLYNDQFGVVNDILMKLNIIHTNVAWLGSASTAMSAMIFTDVWKTSPFLGLMLLAGMQNIPGDLYEAAKVDGAGTIKQFFRITLPLLKPTILVALIFRTMESFRIFDLVFVMTGGGPSNSTETVAVYAYKTLFRNLDFGMGSAMAVLIFFLVFILAMCYIKIIGKDSMR